MKKFMTSIALAFAILSCGGSSSNKTTFTYNLSQEPKTINQTLATSNVAIEILGNTSEGLTKVGKDGNLTLGLAKEIKVSEDGKTYSITLKDGIKWSNGDDITSNDFKFAWLHALNPNTASEYAYMLYYIKGAEEYNSGKGKVEDVAIEVLDDKNLKVELKSTVPYFDSLLAFPTYLPVNEKFLKETGDEYALEASTTLSSGAYILTEWVHNAKMVFEKNPYYYDKDSIKLEKIVAKFIQDSNSELNIFKNGEFDFASLTSEQLDEFKDDPRLTKVVTGTVWYLEFNTLNKVLKNKKIRQAIALAVDKLDITDNIFKKTKSPAYTLTAKGMGTNGKGVEFTTAIGDVIPKYNPEKAKKLLLEGMKELNITELPQISLILNDGGTNLKLGQTIQEQLRKVLGIDINIELMAFKERLGRMKNKNFDIVLAGWGPDYQDPMTYLDLFVTNGGNNHTSFSNKEYDELINIARTVSDKVTRFEAFKKAELILADETPIAALFHNNKYYITTDKYKGYVFPTIGPDKIFKYLEKVK